MTKEELLTRLSDIEWNDFEVKEASGGLPKSMWETVSAFSNTAGGWIILSKLSRILSQHYAPALNSMYFSLQYLTFLQNNHIKKIIRSQALEARYLYIPLR